MPSAHDLGDSEGPEGNCEAVRGLKVSGFYCSAAALSADVVLMLSGSNFREVLLVSEII